MALPENFNSWKHLQDTLRKVHNRLVKDEFSDVEDEPDLNVPRSSLKLACTMQDSDTSDMTVARMLFFLFEYGWAYEQLEPYYGLPTEEVQSNLKFRPILILRFKEDASDAFENGYYPLKSTVKIRLVKETSTTLTRTECLRLAERVKAELCSGNGFKFKRGKELYTYKDVEHGLDYQLYVWDKATAKDVIEKCNSVLELPHNWSNLFSHVPEEPTENYPTNPGTQRILGEQEKNLGSVL